MIPHPNLFWLGLAVTLLGYGSAAYGVTRARRAFTQRRGVWGTVWAVASLAWSRVWAKIRRRSTVRVMSADLGASANLEGTATATRVFPTEGTADQKIEWIFRKLGDHDLAIESLRESHQTTIRRLESVATSERAERTVALERLNERIEQLAGDGLRVTAFGVLLLAAGSVLLAVGAA